MVLGGQRFWVVHDGKMTLRQKLKRLAIVTSKGSRWGSWNEGTSLILSGGKYFKLRIRCAMRNFIIFIWVNLANTEIKNLFAICVNKRETSKRDLVRITRERELFKLTPFSAPRIFHYAKQKKLSASQLTKRTFIFSSFFF